MSHHSGSQDLPTIRRPIRLKLLVAFLSVVLLFGSIHVYVVFQIVHRALEEEFIAKGIMLTRHLAYQLEESILCDDVLELQQHLWGWKSDASQHGYALVVGANREVLASTFADGVPAGLVEANLPPGSRHALRRVLDGEEPYLDVAVPLLEGSAGWVRLGLHAEPVEIPGKRILSLLLGMVVFFVVLGTVGAFVFSHRITSPIREIVRGAEGVDLDGQPLELGIHTSDEMEVLAASFEEMTGRLQRNHRQLSEASRKGFENQKLAALGLLASGIAHEISNPLTGLEIGLKRIAREPQDSTQIANYLPRMLDSLHHMQDVIRQTLAFARPEPLRPSSVHVNELLDHALVLIHHELNEHNIVVDRGGESAMRRIWVDPQSLTQILVNLMLNAVEAMADGGNLSLETASSNGRVQITVADSGPGIAAENLDRIWEPFFTTKDVGQGTGLGLSVTRRLVEKLSGSIEVSSKPGQGATFRVSLPVSPEPEP